MAMKLDDFGQLALSRFTEQLKGYNSSVEQAKSVSSIDEFREKFMENAPELAEYNEQIERIKTALEKVEAERLLAATPLIQPAYDAAVANTGVDVTALDEALKTLRLTRNYLVSIYGEEVLEGTDKIASRAKSGGSATGTGGRRVRGFDAFVDGKIATISVKDKKTGIVHEQSSISAAAKELKVETQVLQTAFFEAAGSEDYKNSSFPNEVEFTFLDHNLRIVRVVQTPDAESTDE